MHGLPCCDWSRLKVDNFLILAGTRQGTVIRAAKRAGLSGKKAAIYRLVREIVRAQYTGGPYNLALEMEWLCELFNLGLPVTMTDRITATDLEYLSSGYERLAGHCRARLLFGATGSGVVAQQARIAEEAAHLLQQHSLHEVRVDVPPSEIIDLRGRGSYVRLMYAEASMDCIVSSHPSRQPSVGTMPPGSAPSAKPRFEGILPFLLHQRIELDGGSGRTVLHLAIGEIPYSNLLSRNTAWDPGRPEPPAEVRQHAITIAVVPVTSDGRVLLSRRATAAGSYPGAIGPYVTGNAELRDRCGLTADRDKFGVPDLLLAACREGMEEVGLDLDRHDLRILGLAQIWSQEDTGIYSLLLSSPLSITAEQAADLTRRSDPVEGSWEVGDELYAVSMWEDHQSVEDVLRWAASDIEVVPHALACLAALAYKTSAVRIADWRKVLDSPSPRPDHITKILPTHQPYR